MAVDSILTTQSASSEMEAVICFTADTHFGHMNILDFLNRPFIDVEEMNEALIENWYHRVEGNDTVYILGDMFFRCSDIDIFIMIHRKTFDCFFKNAIIC